MSESSSDPADEGESRTPRVEPVKDARLVEFDTDDEVESSFSSTTFQVCRVASGANETRRLAMDLRRASLCSRIACLSRSLRSRSSRSLASRRGETALKLSKGLSKRSVPVTGGFDGDEKSINVPSPACPCAPFPVVPRDGLRFALRLRASS